jgi:hypothetical protein
MGAGQHLSRRDEKATALEFSASVDADHTLREEFEQRVNPGGHA